jgi:hypothetical protein
MKDRPSDVERDGEPSALKRGTSLAVRRSMTRPSCLTILSCVVACGSSSIATAPPEISDSGGPPAARVDAGAEASTASDGGARADAATICSGQLALRGPPVDLTSMVNVGKYAGTTLHVAANATTALVAWGSSSGDAVGYVLVNADGSHAPSASSIATTGLARVLGVLVEGADFDILWASAHENPPQVPIAQLGLTRITASGSVWSTQIVASDEGNGYDGHVASSGQVRFAAWAGDGPIFQCAFGNGETFETARSLYEVLGARNYGGAASNLLWTGTDFAFLFDGALARIAPNASAGVLAAQSSFGDPKAIKLAPTLGLLGDGFVSYWASLDSPPGPLPQTATLTFRALRLDRAGAPVGAPAVLAQSFFGWNDIDIGTVGAGAYWNGSEFLLLTSDAGPNADAAIVPTTRRLRVVDASGNALSTPIELPVATFASDPAMAWTGRDYLVAWSDGAVSDLAHTWLARASRCGP